MNDRDSLDARLYTISTMVRSGKIFADIGTDHGYIPVYLVANGHCPSGYACDINALPLKKAQNNIKGNGLEDKIKTILCDGLSAIAGGVDDIIIAGMGGDTIAHIIGEAEFLKNPDVHLVLQPMTKTKKLRRYLYEQGFFIEEEQAVESGRFVYTVLSVYYSGESKNISPVFSYGGKLLEKKDGLSIRYLEHVIAVLEKKAKGQERSATTAEQAKETRDMIDALHQQVQKMKGEV